MSKPRKPVCPSCGKPRQPEFKPFCSRRCRDADLSNWLTGAYAIPIVEENGAEDEDEG